MQGSYIRTESGSDRVFCDRTFIGEMRSCTDLDPDATAPGSDAARSPPLFVQTRRIDFPVCPTPMETAGSAEENILNLLVMP